MAGACIRSGMRAGRIARANLDHPAAGLCDWVFGGVSPLRRRLAPGVRPYETLSQLGQDEPAPI